MTILVTGAFGLVGSATVAELAAQGRRVVATDLDIPPNRKAAEKLLPGVEVRYADLTDPSAVDALVGAVKPDAIVHLAAVIPPFIYLRKPLARKVNVDATGHLVSAAQKQSTPPRFVLASSIAVYGSRNPHTVGGVLTPDTPTNPADVYGAHKVAAEELVRGSDLDWVILRLGGVLTVHMAAYMKSLDNFYFESMLPTDGRLQSVDVRDVAFAFAAATTAPAVGETLLIGGDDSHQQLQGDVASSIVAALGLVGGVPHGLPGNPTSDDDWFNTDWMDSSRAQEVLGFQRHSWPDMLTELADQIGWKRALLRPAAPLSRWFLTRKGAYHHTGKIYADPWNAIAAKWADPRPGSEDQ